MNNKPLEKIKVLDLTRVLAGPYCTMIFKNLGAEIIKIEMPKTGDDSRGFGPYVNDESIYFVSINRGKKSIVVDLKSDEGKDIFLKIIKKVDVVAENFKPGTMEKLGLGYDELKKINPGLIYVAMSGFGHSGPYSQRPAYDMIVQAMGGIMSITGQPDGEPTRVGTSVGDITAGMYGAIGVLSALYSRISTGLGQKVDVAMLDGQLSILENAIARYNATGINPKPMGTVHPSITPFQAFKTKDSWLIIAAGNNKLWESLCILIEKREWIDDPRFATNPDRTKNQPLLSKLLNDIIINKTTDEWMDLLVKNNIPAAPINNMEMIFKDPQVKARNMLVEVSQPGAGKLVISGNPIKMSSIPVDEEIPDAPAPALGEHTAEILKNYIGYDDEKIMEYIKKYS